MTNKLINIIAHGRYQSATVPGRGNRALRLVDRYVGIPLVWVLGLLHRRRTRLSNPERIGLLNTAAIGDTILMSAPVADLRQRYKRSRIIMLVGPSNYEAARMIEGTDLVVKLEVFRPLAAIREIRAHDLNLLVDFAPWARLNALLALFSGADFTIGFNTSGQYRHFAYDRFVTHSAEEHELDNYARLVSALGVAPSHPPSVRYDLGKDEAAISQREPFIVLHMWPGGTGAEFKEWPAERWVQLAEELASRGNNVALTGAPSQSEMNQHFIERIKPVLRHFVSNWAGISLSATACLLSRAELVVSVNTGIMHLADVLRVPLVALHGPTSVKRWGPLNNSSIALEPELPGCGYLNLGFEYPRNPPKCMASISYSQVLQTCRIALDARTSLREQNKVYQGG